MTPSTATASGPLALERPAPPSVDLAAAGAWALPFGLIGLLAFDGGGYDAIVRGQAGLVVWWLILVGALAGTVAVRGRLGWAAIALLAAFTAWTALGLTWTESRERTFVEVARAATLLGVLVLGIAAQRRAAARHAVNGAACAIAGVCGAAVLSRLQPQLFGPDELAALFPGSRNRLAYPLGYWNLEAALAVMGLPLLLAVAGSARTTTGRALAGAAVPVVALCVFLTVSRGGIAAAAIALLVWLLLAPDRLVRLALVAITGAGSVVLCAAADRRGDLQENLGTALAGRQGDELLRLGVVVVVAVGLLAAALALADRHAERPAWSRPGRRVSAVAAALVLALGTGAALAAGGAGELRRQATEFKTLQDRPGTATEDAVGRLRSVSGGGRYQYWQSAARAQATSPLHGIGPGTFEFWWARDGSVSGGFVRDAHSLWFDALAETGVVGLVLVAGLFALTLAGGAARALRARDPEHRMALAAATAAVAGFAVSASLEWAWEMTVVAASALLLAAVALTGRADDGLAPRRPAQDGAPGPAPARRAGPAVVRRLPLAAASLVALVAIGLPTAAASDLRDSEQRADAGDLAGALERARSADAIGSADASARLQQALVLERAGELRPALDAAVRATAAEPTNWRTWVVRSRLEARSGRPSDSVASYRQARALNPRSLLFQRP